MKQEEFKNPNDYDYVGDETISIPVNLYRSLQSLVDKSLSDETQELFPEKYMNIDKTNGDVVKEGAENSIEMVDIEASLGAESFIFRSRNGIKLLQMKLSLEKVHMDMIDLGVAKHIPSLMAEQNKKVEEKS